MLKGFIIKNFRLFRSIRIESLNQVNLFVGKNNTGKSALLEAVQIYSSDASPRLLWNLINSRKEAWRGELESIGHEDVGSPIRHLFIGHRLPELLEEGIILGPTNGEGKCLKIKTAAYRTELDEEQGIRRRVRLEPEDIEATEADIDIMLIAENGDKTRTLFSLDDTEGRRLRPPFPSFVSTETRQPVQIVPTRTMESREIAALWDLVGLTPLESEVILGLKLIDPGIEAVAFVEDLSAGPGRRRIPLVRTEAFSEPVPLNSMGDGVSRLFQIILALVNAKDGVLLVDEFENGLHWTVQGQIWETVFRLAQRLRVQIFATTHSRDCVEAFQSVWRRNEDQGAFYRLLREGDGEVRSIRYDLETLSDAVETEVEVR